VLEFLLRTRISIGNKFVRDTKKYVGRSLRVKILRVNRKRNQIILTQRQVLEEEQKERAEKPG